MAITKYKMNGNDRSQDPQTGLHRGFASLTFDRADSAAKALQQRPHVIDGDKVSCNLHFIFFIEKRYDFWFVFYLDISIDRCNINPLIVRQ